MKRLIELLSPAKTADIGIEAVNHGADAVYIGAPKFSARAAACNSIADIERLTAYAHRFHARVYAAFNTLFTDSEQEEAEQLTWQLYRAGVDALIVQDMSLLQLNIPPISLHASTQTDNRTAEKVHFLEKVGFSQIVLARELSLNEIASIAAQTEARIECFVHGALCVCYSGQCYASQVTRGRSANRGECAQLCRLPCQITDADGKPLTREGHFLSLNDLDLSAHLAAMIDAGVASFKIEGRLKDVDYVKNITAYYRQHLDRVLEGSLNCTKSSAGKVTFFFTPDPQRTFHRGASTYFLNERTRQLVQPATPKSVGQPVGIVKRVDTNSFTFKAMEPLHNGDGLCFTEGNNCIGIKVNRAEGEVITPFKMSKLKTGTMLYRNFDHEFDALLSKKSAERKISVEIDFLETNNGFVIEAKSEPATVSLYFDSEKSPSTKSRDEVVAYLQIQLSKWGNSDFVPQTIRIHIAQAWFIPVSLVNEWRRQVMAKLEQAVKICHNCELRRSKGNTVVQYPEKQLSYLGNVANEAAKKFYRQHGVAHIEPALEAGGVIKSGQPVMATRYCLKYEMGWCASKQQFKQKLREPLYLKGKNDCFQLKFDCNRCEMQLLWCENVIVH